LWNIAAGRVIWSRASDESSSIVSRWSSERRALILEHGYISTEVLDADTGERLALFEELSRDVTPVEAQVYANDLRRKAVVSAANWEFRPVPPPDEAPAADSGHRDHRDRRIVITWIGHRDRSAATLVSSLG
jgi:hypothetical protein